MISSGSSQKIPRRINIEVTETDKVYQDLPQSSTCELLMLRVAKLCVYLNYIWWTYS